MSFGSWLRAIREAHGLTQLELGGLTGIVNTTISAIETGIRLPNLSQAAALAAELQVDQAELIARMVKERLLRTEEGRIFLAEVRAGRLYDNDED